LRYLRYTFTLQMHTFQVGDTLKDAPMTAWGGSLWTLKFEFLCYLLIGLLFTVRKLRPITLLALFVVAAVHGWIHGDDLSGFVAVLAAGSLLALNRRLSPSHGGSQCPQQGWRWSVQP
jgi:peptidoglycan/LPS O-acetylase OafA/YrhL